MLADHQGSLGEEPEGLAHFVELELGFVGVVGELEHGALDPEGLVLLELWLGEGGFEVAVRLSCAERATFRHSIIFRG